MENKALNALARELRDLKRQNDANADRIQEFSDRLDTALEESKEIPAASLKSKGPLDD